MDANELTGPAILLALTVFIAKQTYEWLTSSNAHLKQAIEQNTSAIVRLTGKIDTFEDRMKIVTKVEQDLDVLKRHVRTLRSAETN